MRLNNDNLYVISEGLTELSRVKLKGFLALKVFRIKKKIDDHLLPVFQAMDKIEDEKERENIALEEVEIEIDTIDIKDLEELEELKPETLFKIEKILKED